MYCALEVLTRTSALTACHIQNLRLLGNLRLNFDLPNFAEQEVIAIDLTLRRDYWTKEQIAAHGFLDERTVHAGTIDPIPAAMSRWRPEASRILQNGGAFVIFAAPPRAAQYFRGGYSDRQDTWSFIDAPPS